MQEAAAVQILELNEKTKSYGLVLSPEEVRQMIVARNQVLEQYGRVELSIEVTKEMVEVFSESPFMHNEDYALTLNELHEIFYYLKNETEDKISDCRLIELMKQFFDVDCEGSLELLRSRLEEYAEVFRREVQAKEAMLEGDDE